MELPKLVSPESYAGLYVFDFDGQVAVGYTADEIAVLLESERHADGKAYRLTYTARNTGGDKVRIHLLMHSAPYTNLGLTARKALTTTNKTYVVDFVATASSDNARFRFDMGRFDSDGNDYFFDNVTLVEQ